MRRRGRVRLNLKRGASAQVHGGVRYLEKAFSTTSPTQAWGQLKLVFEALHERKRLLENAPHLCSALPIMTVRAAPRRPWCTAACGARAHACAARQCARARQQSAAGRTGARRGALHGATAAPFIRRGACMVACQARTVQSA